MFYKDKVVLVTGGSGFVGSHLVKQLLVQGAQVRIPVHKNAPRFEHENMQLFTADLTNERDCLVAVEGVDYVFHAAGSVGAAGVKVDTAMASITTNLVMTSLMLQAARAGKVKRFLLYSSSTGYPLADHPVVEDEMWSGPLFKGYFGYGSMRRYLEQLAEYVHTQSEVEIAIVRPTAIYGPGDNFDPQSSHVIAGLIHRAVLKENPFEVWGDGLDIRDFLHVSDLARGSLLMLEKNSTCDPVNIGYGTGFTIKEVVNHVLRAAGHEEATVVYNSSRPSAIPKRVVDTSKAKELLNFEPRVSLEDGIQNTVDWFVQQKQTI